VLQPEFNNQSNFKLEDKSMRKILYAMMAVCALVSGTAQASIDTLDGTLSSPAQADFYSFHVDTAGAVNLYTSAGAPFDPFLTLYSSTSAAPTTVDLTLLGTNDNTTTLNANESGFNTKDAQIKLPLDIGYYLAKVTVASGADPFAYQFNVDTTNVLGTGAVFSGLAAVAAPAAVPLPAAVWLFGTGLMTFLGISKRKGQQQAV
jgi:hypothetical protein